MKLQFSAAEESFRLEVRHFFDEEYPADIKQKVLIGQSGDKSDYQRSDAALAKKGWSAPLWPKEYGGTGWDLTRYYIFDQEMERAGALFPNPSGLIYFGPVLYTYGTPEQQAKWLPGILDGSTQWSQGYSEPNSGSDLASLRCAADLDGDEYVVTGEKIWTSLAHLADWIFCLVRTDSAKAKQQGITFLCIDLTSPGVSVHPIPSIDGKHHINRVLFDQVRVPIDNRIGEEGHGWTYANFLLGNERVSYAHVGAKKRDLKTLKEIARQTSSLDGSLFDEALFASKFARAEINLRLLEYTTLRLLSNSKEKGQLGQEAAIIKILATELAQEISTLFLETMGHDILPLCQDGVSEPWFDQAGVFEGAPAATSKYLCDRSQTIYGGTNEIQRNLIAKRILGM